MGRLNIVVKSSVPPPPYNYEIVCVPVEAIPLALIALRIQRAKYWYATEDDHQHGIDLVTQLESALLMPCGNDIINAINAQTIMLRAYMAGLETTTTGTGTDEDPYIYTPPISQEGYPFDHEQPSLATAAQDTQRLLQNLVDGTPTSLTSETRNFRDQLEQIRVAISEQDLDTEEVESLLNAIILLL